MVFALVARSLTFHFSVISWIYASVKKEMAKGIIKVILRVFDIIEYLLDVHDAINNAAKKRDNYLDKEKSTDCLVTDNNNVDTDCLVTEKNNVDVVQYLDDIINVDRKDKKTKIHVEGSELVSFTVALTDLPSDKSDTVVTFDQIISNEGHGFDSNNGKFICPVPGVYVFFFSSADSDNKPSISLVKDGLFVDANVSKKGDLLNHMAFVELKKDDQVWLKYATDVIVKEKDVRFSTFSGFLLYGY